MFAIREARVGTIVLTAGTIWRHLLQLQIKFELTVRFVRHLPGFASQS